ncbi:MAG TPA: dTDP-4-dehydrorhamnose 3,5-epimerase [Thermodesulfobacteriaceae bacterium]|nr:dTDP-4-dehydrorhamnose 3,5-epimerase [Thermodesulfobacteriaceae bacterium]
MIFSETVLKGAYIITPEKCYDERGFFARTWCQKEFSDHSLDTRLVQCNISFNNKRGTLRGMHFQVAPFAEAKLVRCTRGAIFDVIVDIRPKSATYKQWISVELSADNHHMLFIPEGFAHGFQTLADNTEIFYQMSEFFSPEHARGVHWSDPDFNITWPEKITIISEKDQNLGPFSEKLLR